MPSLKTSVAILGTVAQKAKDLGAEIFETFQELDNTLLTLPSDNGPSVLVLEYSKIDAALAPQWLLATQKKWPLIQIILVAKTQSDIFLKSVINTGSVFKILSSFNDPYFESSIQEALATVDLIKQTELLEQLSEEQNQKLISLQKELEDRVEKRQQNLSDSREKLIRTSRRTESLHRAIVAIQKSKSIKEIERLVAEALFPSLQILSIHVSFMSNRLTPSLGADKGFCNVPLIRDGITIGHVLFARSLPFTESEQEFLDQLSSAIALAIDRLAKFEQAEILKQQWESTFDAITEPVAIIDKQYNVIRANATFSEFSANSDVRNKKCYTLLFGRTTPCEACKMGSRFELSQVQTQDKATRTLLVSSQNFEDTDSIGYINIYNDVTEKRMLEKKILHSAKLAELGTVGGSIAHELNNPIAGMLTFTQLIRMDLKGDEWFFDDILEIEKGILRCRDIIQNLLSSIRRMATEPVKYLKDK